MKSTTIENQIVILSFGTSQFVTSVDSRNRTHDKKVATKRVPKISLKKLNKNARQKRYNHKNTQLFSRLFFICSHDILTNLAVFETRKKTRWHMLYSVLGNVSGCRSPSTSHGGQNRFLFHRGIRATIIWANFEFRLTIIWTINVQTMVNL